MAARAGGGISRWKRTGSGAVVRLGQRVGLGKDSVRSKRTQSLQGMVRMEESGRSSQTGCAQGGVIWKSDQGIWGNRSERGRLVAFHDFSRFPLAREVM